MTCRAVRRLLLWSDLKSAAPLSLGKLTVTGLYLDTNKNGSWKAKDELIGFLVGVTPDTMSVAQDLIKV